MRIAACQWGRLNGSSEAIWAGVAAWICLGPLVASAALGVIRTLDGHTPQGEVYLVPPSTLAVVTAPGSDPFRVDLANLLCVVYRSWNGQSWMLLMREDLEMPETIHVGLALFSRNPKSAQQAVMDQVTLGRLTPAEPFPPRVVLVDGSVMVNTVESADTTSVRLSRRAGAATLRTRQVAAFQFQPMPRKQTLSFERPGVMKANGDFLDAEFLGLENNRLKVSSVLYGTATLDAHHEVAAVILHGVTPRLATYAIKTIAGSVWQADRVTIETEGLVFSNSIAGPVTIEPSNLLEIRRNLPPR